MVYGIGADTLAGLPKPVVIDEFDIETILTATRNRLVALYPDIEAVIDLETELSRMNIEVTAYREGLIRGAINDAARASLLAFAQSGDLDHLAAFYDVPRMAEEDDARLKARVILAIQGRSTGGTAPRYRFIAMSSDVRVADAIAWVEGKNPMVNIAVFSTDAGGVADQALLDIVSLAVNAKEVRMVNDTFAIVSAVSQSIDIEVDVWMLPAAPAETLAGLEAGLRTAHNAENGLGFDLTSAWIVSRLMVPGVQRVEVKLPLVDVVVEPNTAVTIGTVTINDKGRAY